MAFSTMTREEVAGATLERPPAWPTPQEGADMPKRTVLDRFWSKVDVRGPDECWPWTASKVKGYGSFGITPDLTVLAHRFAFEATRGEIPHGKFLDHTCHNGTGCRLGDGCPHRGCCNPAHLDPCSSAENTRRAFEPWTHCLRGHPLSGENLRLDKKGRRHCRACARIVWLAWVDQPGVRERLAEKEKLRQVGRRKGRTPKTHCPQGHPYDEENTCVKADGRRTCRACGREYMRRKRAAS